MEYKYHNILEPRPKLEEIIGFPAVPKALLGNGEGYRQVSFLT